MKLNAAEKEIILAGLENLQAQLYTERTAAEDALRFMQDNKATPAELQEKAERIGSIVARHQQTRELAKRFTA